jgi:DNA-directed RNA polymerase specialized sigma24 family protein
MNMSELPLEELIRLCESERADFRQSYEQQSPACMTLFRRAFAGDQVAWSYIFTLFGRMQYLWIRRSFDAASSKGVHVDIEEDDIQGILHDALIALHRASQRNPDLTATNDLAKLFQYWKKCIQTAVLTVLRTKRRQRLTDRLTQSVPNNNNYDLEFKVALWQRILTLLSEEELVILRLDLQGYKPQDIVHKFPQRFPNVQRIYQIKQNYLRRLQQDYIIRDLFGLQPLTRKH